MRWIGVIVGFALMAAFARPVLGDTIVETKLIGTRVIPTGSPVVPELLQLDGDPNRFAADACVPRIILVYYDSVGNRSGDDELVRNGAT